MVKEYKLSYACVLSIFFYAMWMTSKEPSFFERAETIDVSDVHLSTEDLKNIIVFRNLGNFAAGTIKSDLIGTVTGLATLNVLKSGDTMSGSLTLPAGTVNNPSLKFTSSTNTGICAAAANALSLCCNGLEKILVNTTQATCRIPLTVEGLFCTVGATVNQAIQKVNLTSGQSVTVSAGTSILLLTPAGLVTSATITFPASPVEGQYFTIINGSDNSILSITSSAPGLSIVNAITSLQPLGISISALIAYTTVTYIYSGGTWYRWNRG